MPGGERPLAACPDRTCEDRFLGKAGLQERTEHIWSRKLAYNDQGRGEIQLYSPSSV